MTTSESVPAPPLGAGKSSFIRSHGSTLLGQGIVLGLGVVTGVLTARLLGPAGRGEYAAIILWPTAIASVLSLVNQAVAFHVGRRIFTVSEMATSLLAVSVVQSSLSVLIGLVVVHFALARYSPTVQHLGVVFVCFTPAYLASGYPANLFQGLPDMFRYNIVRVSTPIIYCTCLLTIILMHRSTLTLVIFAQVWSSVAALALGVYLVMTRLKPHLKWNSAAIPKLVSYGLRTQATNLANYFNQRIDQLLLSLFVPPQQLGYYAVAVTLSTAVTVFPQAAGVVTFSRGSGQQVQDAKATIGHSFRASLIWLLIVCSGLFLIAPFLIHLVFGRAFDGSILACRILLPGALMIGLNQVLYGGANALGRPGLPSCAEGVSMGVTAVGLYFMIPRYGYIGAAIVSTVAYTVSFIIMLGIAHNILGLKVRDLFLGGSVPAAAAS